MSKPVRSRRTIALVAAYVVALQVLLLPLSVAAVPALGSSLCVTSNEASQPPASHETGCPCTAGCGMLCCGQALAGSPQAIAILGLMRPSVLTPARTIEPVVRLPDKGPQIPRAPPVA
jgi:hypothetical protein